MKNVSYIINGVLAVAIIILFILFFTSNKNGTSEDIPTTPKFTGGDSVMLPLAYINVDSIYLNYNLAKDAGEALMKRYKSSTATMAQKEKQLRAEYDEFDRKLQNNAFLSEERAQQEAIRIKKMDADVQAQGRKFQQEYADEQQKMNVQIADSVRLCLKEYNKIANYEIIFSNAGLDNILLAKDSYDITDKIIKILNSRYKPAASK